MPDQFHRILQTIQRKSMKPSAFTITVFGLLIYFATAINGFSPFSTPLKIHQRKFYQNNDIIRQQDLLLPHKLRDVTPRRPMMNLRGGFMLLPTENPLLNPIGIYAVSNFVGFFISSVTGSHLHLDLVGSGAFAVAAAPNLSSSVAHIRWSSAAIVLWGTKLALFLFFRATQVKYDTRLTDLLASPKGISQFWFITFLWNIMSSLPYLIGLGSDRENILALVSGGILYLVGFTIETLADGQKYFFKQRQSQAPVNQFCNVGLWKYSQHPNWFGNLILWSGILVMNLPALIDPIPVAEGTNTSLIMRLWSFRKLVLAVLGPSFLWLLFSAQAEGSMTPAVELANAKYGKNAEYAKYVKEVPLIIPNLFKFW